MPPEDASKWLVLGIESSCDDTAAAVISGDGIVRSHRIASQVRDRAPIIVSSVSWSQSPFRPRALK